MIKPCLALVEDYSKLAIPLRNCGGAQAVMTKLMIRLQTQKGAWGDDETFGIAWPDIGPEITAVEIEGLIRIQADQVDGVIEIIRCTVTKIGDQVTIDLYVRIEDPAGPQIVQIGLLQTAGNYPEAWYNMLGIDFESECPI